MGAPARRDRSRLARAEDGSLRSLSTRRSALRAQRSSLIRERAFGSTWDASHMTDHISTEQAVETLAASAMAVRRRYADFETRRIGREWTTPELMSGFVVDVGDLTRLVMAATGARQLDDVQTKIEHELADCLWSVLVLADRLGVNLASAFDRTMQDLTAFLDEN